MASRCLRLLVIREMKIITTMSYHNTLTSRRLTYQVLVKMWSTWDLTTWWECKVVTTLEDSLAVT